ncbi:MAG: hypothetical protein MUP81_06350 [Dehalococcoidia bacterium]|nr:hypothetical protein [Dehalococcoidia bacterium]
MSTYQTCSECDEILWELAEREADMCFKCQAKLDNRKTELCVSPLRKPKDWKQQVDSDGLFNPDVPNPSEDI